TEMAIVSCCSTTATSPGSARRFRRWPSSLRMSSFRRRSMADLISEPGYDLDCLGCGAGVRPIDRFCSQCGRRDPADRALQGDDPELTSPTLVSGDTGKREKTYPTFVAKEAQSEVTLIKSVRKRTRPGT